MDTQKSIALASLITRKETKGK